MWAVVGAEHGLEEPEGHCFRSVTHGKSAAAGRPARAQPPFENRAERCKPSQFCAFRWVATLHAESWRQNVDGMLTTAEAPSKAPWRRWQSQIDSAHVEGSAACCARKLREGQESWVSRHGAENAVKSGVGSGQAVQGERKLGGQASSKRTGWISPATRLLLAIVERRHCQTSPIQAPQLAHLGPDRGRSCRHGPGVGPKGLELAHHTRPTRTLRVAGAAPYPGDTNHKGSRGWRGESWPAGSWRCGGHQAAPRIEALRGRRSVRGQAARPPPKRRIGQTNQGRRHAAAACDKEAFHAQR